MITAVPEEVQLPAPCVLLWFPCTQKGRNVRQFNVLAVLGLVGQARVAANQTWAWCRIIAADLLTNFSPGCWQGPAVIIPTTAASPCVSASGSLVLPPPRELFPCCECVYETRMLFPGHWVFVFPRAVTGWEKSCHFSITASLFRHTHPHTIFSPGQWYSCSFISDNCFIIVIQLTWKPCGWKKAETQSRENL